MLVNELYQGGIRALIAWDSTLFDNMTLPTDEDGTAVTSIDDIVDTILFKFGDAPLFCPDPAVMKFYITKWSARRQPQWNRFYAAISEKYDPLENYDRLEKTSDYLTHGHKITTDDDLTHGETVTTDDDLQHGLTTEAQISASNSSTYQPDAKNINSGTDQRDITEEHTGTDERDYEETHSGIDKRDYDSHIHGNIGVTTSQQMLTSELELIPKLDLLAFIADDFHQEFCLMMYN